MVVHHCDLCGKKIEGDPWSKIDFDKFSVIFYFNNLVNGKARGSEFFKTEIEMCPSCVNYIGMPLIKAVREIRDDCPKKDERERSITPQHD